MGIIALSMCWLTHRIPGMGMLDAAGQKFEQGQTALVFFCEVRYNQ